MRLSKSRHPTRWALGALQLSAWLEDISQPHRCRISESRSSLAAVGCVAMFIFVSLRVVLFWLGNGMVEWAGVCLLISCTSLMPCADSSGVSNAVDIFNATSGAWSTAALSVARCCHAATSLPNLGVAIFAGGDSTCFHVDFRIFACCVVRVWEMGWLSRRRLVC